MIRQTASKLENTPIATRMALVRNQSPNKRQNFHQRWNNAHIQKCPVQEIVRSYQPSFGA